MALLLCLYREVSVLGGPGSGRQERTLRSVAPRAALLLHLRAPLPLLLAELQQDSAQPQALGGGGVLSRQPFVPLLLGTQGCELPARGGARGRAGLVLLHGRLPLAPWYARRRFTEEWAGS